MFTRITMRDKYGYYGVFITDANGNYLNII